MTHAEFKTRLQIIENEAINNKNRLYVEYAHANSSVQTGDIVTDHIGSVRVEKISVFVDRIGGEIAPRCKYIGVELKKDLTPTKKGNKRTVYQSNLIENKL